MGGDGGDTQDTGFDVLDYLELQAPHGGDERPFFATAEWAHRFPSEQVWRARKAVVAGSR